MAASPADDLQATKNRLADLLAQMREALASEEQRLRGSAPQPPATRKVASAPGRPGLRIIPSGPPAAAPPPIPDTTLAVLQALLTGGMKQRSFDDTAEVIAPDTITDKGASYDAGQYWDSWILIPTIDTKISFTGLPNQNTPTVPGSSTYTAQVHKRTVYYQSANAGTSGRLNIFLARWVV